MADGSSKIYRWGILGAGIIAEKMAGALALDPRSEVVGVASKSAQRAEDFTSRFSIPRALSYEQLAADPDIDIIYVATTHNFHRENAELVLKSGKALLMEKPFTVNAREAEEIFSLAGEKNLFAMEAMWVRFLPSLIELQRIINTGTIGEPLQAAVSFNGYAPAKYLGRLEDPALAGGVTLDKGVYPISVLSYLLGGTPESVQANARMSSRGVDETADYQFRFPSGALGQVSTSFAMNGGNGALIYGSKAYIEFHGFPAGERFTVHVHDGSDTVRSSEEHHIANPENGFVCQAAECVRCLDAGLRESPIMPWDESIAIMKVMDDIRGQIGLRYAFE
jgi:dihydrodiol dehydrogenase / D-xylose 1-dehydrogenase (NADP)